jgi:hypothetical protein
VTSTERCRRPAEKGRDVPEPSYQKIALKPPNSFEFRNEILVKLHV